MKKVDLTGKKFGKLTVLGRDISVVKTHCQWFVRCDCGEELRVRGTSLTQGGTVSCGCHRKDRGAKMFTKHGYYYHSAYKSWSKMMARCNNPNSPDYKDYGARGITVCERWHDVKNFCDDMGEKPKGKYSIDRIDVNGNYEPSNCRWANDVEQANNRRTSSAIEYEGKICTYANLAREKGIKPEDLRYYIARRGLSVTDAIAACT